jgi:hypothetical protein
MADYERKSKGIVLLRRMLNQNGRAKLAGDKLQVYITIGEVKEILREIDELETVAKAKK